MRALCVLSVVCVALAVAALISAAFAAEAGNVLVSVSLFLGAGSFTFNAVALFYVRESRRHLDSSS
ncbi:MAG TPA: hypothetical protein VK054_06290 [Beutenbergiaceae bacterium]|nr:hypothetical protein [Beutenbergiaceae bacterium]